MKWDFVFNLDKEKKLSEHILNLIKSENILTSEILDLGSIKKFIIKWFRNMNLKNFLKQKKNCNKLIEITNRGGIIKQNQFKEWFEIRKIIVKRMSIKFESREKLRGMNLKRHANFINYSR